jgi:nitrate reductase assembly molybdenum cofactor insertion protein NarJ
MPKKPRRTKRLNIPVTEAEHKHAHKEASARGKETSEAVRDALRANGLLPSPRGETPDAL